QSPGPSPLVASVLNQGPFPPPALPGFSGTTSLSATPARPACPSRASGLIIPDHAQGLPVLRALSLCTCCRHYPGAADGRRLRSCHPTVPAFPGSTSGSACTSSFSRLAQRSLALRPAHSHGRRMSCPLSEGFRHFVSSMSAPVASGWSGRRVGLAPTGKAPPCHGARGIDVLLVVVEFGDHFFDLRDQGRQRCLQGILQEARGIDLVLKVFGRTHHLGIAGVDGIVGVAFIGAFTLEPTDQLPGRVEILFHILEFGCRRCLGSHLDHRRGQRSRGLLYAGTDVHAGHHPYITRGFSAR